MAWETVVWVTAVWVTEAWATVVWVTVVAHRPIVHHSGEDTVVVLVVANVAEVKAKSSEEVALATILGVDLTHGNNSLKGNNNSKARVGATCGIKAMVVVDRWVVVKEEVDRIPGETQEVHRIKAITLAAAEIGTTKVATMRDLETTKVILEVRIGAASVNFLISIPFLPVLLKCLYF